MKIYYFHVVNKCPRSGFDVAQPGRYLDQNDG